MRDDGLMAGALSRLQGTRSLRAKVAGQRIPCSFLWVGLVRWALAKGSPTDYIMYITVLYWGGWWTLECMPQGGEDEEKGYSSWVDTAVLFIVFNAAVRKHRVT